MMLCSAASQPVLILPLSAPIQPGEQAATVLPSDLGKQEPPVSRGPGQTNEHPVSAGPQALPQTRLLASRPQA